MTELTEFLRHRIETTGPLPVADFMSACLVHPQWGYYTRKDPLGAAGDFITAPEISQMFGELIGLWAGIVWQSMGEPSEVVVAELGPGRGTLMADFLRASDMLPAFRRALRVHLVEISPALRAIQHQTLKDEHITWLDDARNLPDGPLLLIANEFFDALPIRQFVKRVDGWHERLVGLDGAKLVMTDGPVVDIDTPEAGPGDIFEVNSQARNYARWLGCRLTDQGGAALIIDYGHANSAVGDTLQAVRGHRYADILDSPGDVDLSAHVDFQAIADAASPAIATDVVTQGAFLRSLGIELRADRLITAAPQKADVIATACRRLIEPSGMGTLFKVRALTHPGLPTPPGFVR
ncbi:SAM-dependent methyltransferase [Telmatospirillum sp.]|uniref:class I SAM-dependent methyltransferase n=1 Tax=Telmatospirillum sp. TaxID=2079197 RepID=UPI00283D10DC|nr:SAM-dependent methyltransferase [Telmatospirillum sp.]MDR3438480.1 SAM-dependent methyltransferase [Telmatospirillum sp.]